MSDITLQIEPVSSNGSLKARVTAVHDSQVVEMNTFDLASSTSRTRFLSAVTSQCEHADRNALNAELLKYADEMQQQPPITQAPTSMPEVNEEDRREAMRMLTSPGLISEIVRDIRALGIEGEQNTTLLIYLICTSRLLSSPVGGVMQGPTGAGKTFLIERVTSMVPPEAKFVATSMSPKSWFYLGDRTRLTHKVVVLGERKQATGPDNIDDGLAFRQLFTEKRITRAVTTRSPETGRPETTEITVEGPIAFLETTTSEKLFDEDASRLLPLRPDESREQTRAVLRRIGQDKAGQRQITGERDAILRRHHTAQRLLGEFTDPVIIIPFAPFLADAMPSEKVVTRRCFSYLLAVIEAVALLRVFSKPEDKRDPIIADEVDYAMASMVMETIIRRQLGDLNDADEALCQQLPAGASFTSHDVARLLGVSSRQASRRLGRLMSLDLIEETSQSTRNKKVYRKLAGAQTAGSMVGLPSVEDVAAWLAANSSDAGAFTSLRSADGDGPGGPALATDSPVAVEAVAPDGDACSPSLVLEERR